ncbi:hypothetical protein A2U01_0119263, partial [Trifolium medium]|nr:hypothetical protein [Trifolium medium]
MFGKPGNHLRCQGRVHPLGILQGGSPRGIAKLPDSFT